MAALNLLAGKAAEQKACEFLLKQGLTLISKNYRCKQGEIDLIMRDGQDIVFIEIRLRTNKNFGSAIESINESKQKKILRTAIHFLRGRQWLHTKNCRFDVIGMSDNHFEWIKNAFTA